MKSKLTTKDRKRFRNDFTTVLTLSLASNARGLGKKDKDSVKECIKEGDYNRAWKILGKQYSLKEWEAFVKAQAAPLMKDYA